MSDKLNKRETQSLENAKKRGYVVATTSKNGDNVVDAYRRYCVETKAPLVVVRSKQFRCSVTVDLQPTVTGKGQRRYFNMIALWLTLKQIAQTHGIEQLMLKRVLRLNLDTLEFREIPLVAGKQLARDLLTTIPSFTVPQIRRRQKPAAGRAS